MKRTRIIVVAAAILMGYGIYFQSSPAHAADDTTTENITLTPAVTRKSLTAGETQSGKLTVINDGAAEYTFVVYARPYSVKGEQYDPNFTIVNERTQAYQWMSFNQTEFRLAAGQRVDVPYTITVPTAASSGGHYAVIFAETQPEGTESSSVMRKKRVGSLLYMTVNGQIKESGSLESWDVSLWQQKRPLTSQVRVKNSGNTHFEAIIRVRYSGILGSQSTDITKKLLILPGTTRRIPIEWTDGPTVGLFKASGNIAYLDKTDNLEGRYVILLPISLLIGGVVTLIVIGITLITWRRSNRHSHRR